MVKSKIGPHPPEQLSRSIPSIFFTLKPCNKYGYEKYVQILNKHFEYTLFYVQVCPSKVHRMYF